jgi:hypothetical protein
MTKLSSCAFVPDDPVPEGGFPESATGVCPIATPEKNKSNTAAWIVVLAFNFIKLLRSTLPLARMPCGFLAT